MTITTLRENVVSDDILYMADDNKVFKGGYIAIVEYHTYANEWNDRKHRKCFRKLDTLYKYLDKNYKDFIF